ncbi:hypothetical protein TSUD_93050 [Trifolium subterraneum]|uniref:Uncharacterized protein n=1 Tax=Trifolium subterraneum TaxID=3900 RepID=A0A2Z6NKJ1_TRISU|nr:hypothetical protein TSUD_93050 [Trifolium subterraneum]
MRETGDGDGLATELTAKFYKNYEMSNSNQTDSQSSLADSTVVADTGVDTDTDEGKEVNDTGKEEAASTAGSSEVEDTAVDTDTGEDKEVIDAGTLEAASSAVGSTEVERETMSADDNNEVDIEASSDAGIKMVVASTLVGASSAILRTALSIIS